MTRLVGFAGGAVTVVLLIALACLPAGVLVLGLWLWRRAERRV